MSFPSLVRVLVVLALGLLASSCASSPTGEPEETADTEAVTAVPTPSQTQRLDAIRSAARASLSEARIEETIDFGAAGSVDIVRTVELDEESGDVGFQAQFDHQQLAADVQAMVELAYWRTLADSGIPESTVGSLRALATDSDVDIDEFVAGTVSLSSDHVTVESCAVNELASCIDAAEPTPVPTPTVDPRPTATAPPASTATPVPEPTATPRPAPTATRVPQPTAPPTATPVPAPTTTPQPVPTATLAPPPPPTPTQPPARRYANCSEARAAGVTPLFRGDPGYGTHLDRDGDGIACE